jgi:hypothetical protein
MAEAHADGGVLCARPESCLPDVAVTEPGVVGLSSAVTGLAAGEPPGER